MIAFSLCINFLEIRCRFSSKVNFLLLQLFFVLFPYTPGVYRKKNDSIDSKNHRKFIQKYSTFIIPTINWVLGNLSPPNFSVTWQFHFRLNKFVSSFFFFKSYILVLVWISQENWNKGTKKKISSEYFAVKGQTKCMFFLAFL